MVGWTVGIAVGALSVLGWMFVLLSPDRAWDMSPIAEDEPLPPDPGTWPAVCILIPARNERESLPRTLPSLLAQDYPGQCRIVIVDDRSSDGTAEVAASLGDHRTTVVRGKDLPEGWVGKVWALHQGATASSESLLLLTDADILHGPQSLRRLVAEALGHGLALNSLMARLRCESQAERLLIPPFVWFFFMLYPMRRVNCSTDSVAAAAGGCVLLLRSALDKAGGFHSIRGEIIDDLNLARLIKSSGGGIRLRLSRAEVVSLRQYATLGPIWRMVRRSAFTEMKHSWLMVAGAIVCLLLMFIAPVVLLVGGGAIALVDPTYLPLGLLGLISWALLTMLYRPATRYFGLSPFWTLTLPLAGALYGLMTLDSAVRGRRRDWR